MSHLLKCLLRRLPPPHISSMTSQETERNSKKPFSGNNLFIYIKINAKSQELTAVLKTQFLGSFPPERSLRCVFTRLQLLWNALQKVSLN